MSEEADLLDTNVILYLLSGDAVKAGRAQALLEAGGTVSVPLDSRMRGLGSSGSLLEVRSNGRPLYSK